MRLRLGLALVVVAAIGAVMAAVVVATSRGEASRTPGADPGTFAIGVMRQIVQNRYAEAWETLHPVDRRVATKEEYVRCEDRSPVTARFLRARAGHVADESVGLGNGRFVDSKAVEVLVRLESEGVAPFVVRHTVHVIAVEGHWTWIFPAWRYGYFRDDLCPTGERAPAPAS